MSGRTSEWRVGWLETGVLAATRTDPNRYLMHSWRFFFFFLERGSRSESKTVDEEEEGLKGEGMSGNAKADYTNRAGINKCKM